MKGSTGSMMSEYICSVCEEYFEEMPEEGICPICGEDAIFSFGYFNDRLEDC